MDIINTKILITPSANSMTNITENIKNIEIDNGLRLPFVLRSVVFIILHFRLFIIHIF